MEGVFFHFRHRCGPSTFVRGTWHKQAVPDWFVRLAGNILVYRLGYAKAVSMSTALAMLM